MRSIDMLQKSCWWVLLPAIWAANVRAEPPFPATLDEPYLAEIRPLIQRYCFDCHSADVAEADLDLSSFRTVDQVREQAKVWVQIRQILLSGQMPPESADQTDQWMARIQAFYRQFTADGGGTAVDLQGIKFQTNQGGLLPIADYLAVTIQQREALTSGRSTIDQMAEQRGLNARYLATLWAALTEDDGPPSMFLDALRERWRQAAPADVPVLTAEIEQAQQTLWKFNAIGQFGREGGPTRWMEPVSPVVTSHELRCPLPDTSPNEEVRLVLTAHDLGDGNDQDFVVWQRPRLEFKPTDIGPAPTTTTARCVSRTWGSIT